MKDKKQVAKISVFITSIFVIFLSVTYAFITQVITGEKNLVIQAGTLDLVLEEENEITIENALPIHDEVGMIQDKVFNFSLVNKTGNSTDYILKLNKISTSNELNPSQVKYYLTKDGIGTPKLLSTLTNGKIDEGTIDGSATIRYSLRLWIDSSVSNNSDISGKSLSYRIDVEVGQKIPPIELAPGLEVAVDTSTTIDFSKISSATNGRGIYKYKEDGVDIYYWRGKVSEIEGADNHVLFANLCWEMVRTTKTGGIKIIYDGEPVVVDGVKTCPNTGAASQLTSTSAFNSNYNDNAYVGYMYGLTGVSEELSSPQCIKKNSAGTAAEVGTERAEAECTQAGGKWVTTAYEATHANVIDSKIKGVIDTWYESKMLDYTDKLEDAVYCNDRSIDTISGYGTGLGYGGNKTAYSARYRLATNKIPSLECVNRNDRFTVREENGNGDLTYPVGLITADETSLAGGIYGQQNSDYYLYTGKDYQSLSPYRFDSGFTIKFDVSNLGNLTDNLVNRTLGVRPVVSLIAGTNFTVGDGTETNPYVVE